MTTPKKKLIEVALPLDAINEEGSRRKRKAPAGFPTTLHKWWAQRPIAAARAVIFAQMVDDPSAHPDLFPTEKKQDKERQRLFRIIEELVKWDNTNDERVLQAARDEIWQSWRSTCAENVDHPHAKQLFDRFALPPFLDPFAGSGAIPLEAQRLGLESYASDLNPVAVLINKAMIEVPPKFAGKPPVHHGRAARLEGMDSWRGGRGLAEDVRYYGNWIGEEAERRLGRYYPKVTVDANLVKARKDLKPLVGRQLKVAAYLWARTVRSPNPAFASVEVPLITTFLLSSKEGREVYVEPVVEGANYRFTVKAGKPNDRAAVSAGTKLGRGSNFRCLLSGSPISGDYIKEEGKAGRLGAKLMAVVADAGRSRVYLPATAELEEAAWKAKPFWKPEGDVPARLTGGTCVPYGLDGWADLFTPRQLVALATISDLVQEVRDVIGKDAVAAGFDDDEVSMSDGGSGAAAYAEAVELYLAFAASRAIDYGSTISTWRAKDSAMRSTLAKQAIPMTWDFAEGSPLGSTSSGLLECVEVIAKVLETSLGCHAPGHAAQADAASDARFAIQPVVSTDPPYYSNVGYADLADFFYVWLRRTLRGHFPDLFGTMAVPKSEELVAAAYRHGSSEKAEAFFLDGMTRAMHRLARQAHPAYPITIYYAFKQAETEDEEGTSSTGWETFLDAVIRAGLAITGTWPMRTEGDNRQVSIGSNALASSIVLVCRPRPENASIATRREFLSALMADLPGALAHLQRENIAPVDLAQAAIGPGMAVFTRYAKVLDAEGKPLSVREALAIINQVLDEALAEQEGDFDADSRWAVAWFEQAGFADGEFGVADVLARAKNTAVAGLVDGGVVKSSRGKVRLLRATELPGDWDPATDRRLSAWEVVHHLIRALETGGELGAAALVAKLGAKAEVARELAYRLYTLCERKKRAAEALAYNGLVQSWPEITRLAREGGKARPGTQGGLFAKDEE